MDKQRPTPEEMLARAEREAERARRGRLKVFFGAMPGVGKTYAMLEAAHSRARQGTDVVVGWLETHGRADTAALLEGFERLPPQKRAYKGVELQEFDLDGALARHPTLLLLDELAHTNAPGSRHARRWQEVPELLEAGIEVWTTLNVQHVESLNDVVAQITGVTVRETVPDSLIDAADEIEVVDLPPDELLQRLAEGKVYLPTQAAAARENFFQKGNLIALRELVLRRAAERVEAQGDEWKREHGIDETWRTQERLLVAFDHTERSADLIRAARRMAAALHAPWVALTVEDPRIAGLPDEDRERLSESIALAQRLGADTLVLRGGDVAAQVLAVAQERSITRVIVGRPRQSWRRFLRTSPAEEIVRRAGEIDVLVTFGEPARMRGARRPLPTSRIAPTEWFWPFVAIAVATAICWITREVFTLADQAMLYLLAVLVASSRMSRWPAMLTALGSIAALDFFFVPPVMTFAVTSPKYVVTFGVMLLVAIAVSRRTVRMREQAEEARERDRRRAALFTMSRDFGRAEGRADVAAIAVRHVRALFMREALVLLSTPDGQLEPIAGEAQGRSASERDLAVAQWVASHGQPAGRGTDTLPASAALFLPLVGTQQIFGALGVFSNDDDSELTPSQRQLLEAFAAQIALALERVVLGEEAEGARLAAEAERTRSTLLSAVSHDLRTPLASIGGAAQVLLDREHPVGEGARRELLETVQEESERLTRLVGNLLDLTRLEAQTFVPVREWVPAEEVLDSALSRVRPRLGGRKITLGVSKEVLEVHGDPVLLEQALINLLENAAKHTPAGSPIELAARMEQDEVVFEVADRGSGLAPGDERRVFEKYYRGIEGRGVHGFGLGLAVVQAIARVHNGSAKAERRPAGGATFSFAIPGARLAGERE